MSVRKKKNDFETLRLKYPDLYRIWSSFPPVENKGGATDGKFDLRESASETWKNYRGLVSKAILNNVAWLEMQKISLDFARIASGVVKNAEGEICGYDFMLDSPIEPPCMTSSAAFPMRYAHVLPALMISNFMKRTQNDKVDMTVLCRGYGFEEEEKWWTEDTSATADDAAKCVVESEAFQSCVRTPRTKPIKRICVWMLCIGHVFMVVWEQGDCHDSVYFSDNAVGDRSIDSFRNDFLQKFRDRLSPHRSKANNVLKGDFLERSIFSTSQIQIQPDLMCVSFMARSTVYLNTMDDFLGRDALGFIVELVSVRNQASRYLKFEKALAEFLTARLMREGLCVWLPEVMKNKFVNISDICLLVFDPTIEGGLENANRYEYFLGDWMSFRDAKKKTGIAFAGNNKECTVSSAMRECRRVLDFALGLLEK